MSRARLLLPLLLCAAAIGQDPDAGTDSNPELRNGTFQEATFASTALERDSQYGVFLPKGYDAPENKDRRYPLVVWLHGMWEDHQRFFTRGGAPVLDRLIGEAKVPDLILVTANGGRSSFYMNGKNGGAYEDLVTQDLLREIEAKYRVYSEPAMRALVGVSMGGYGALKIALKKPRLFGAVAAHSAAILPRKHEDLDKQFPWLQQWGGGQRVLGSIFGKPIDEALWAAESVLTLADSLDPATIEGLRIYFDCGSADRLGLDKPNAELHELLERKKVPHTWKLIDGGGHGWRTGYNQGAVERSLVFLAQVWSAAASSEPPSTPAAGASAGPDKRLR
jgi:S-formylglutathione hydrolase FrmB